MPLSSTKCHNWIFFSTIWVVLQQHIWHKTITEQHGRLWDSLPTPPPQFPRDLRAAPTLPGLANPPLEGVRLARLSSVHRVKWSVCPKEPVNTSFSDLLHSTANVKPRYPPWMVSQTQLSPMVTKLGPRGALWCAVWRQAPSLLAGRGRLCPGLRPAQSEKVMAQFFRICSDRSQKKTRFGENEQKVQPKLSTGYSHAAQLNKVS